MVESRIINIAKSYKNALSSLGFHVKKVILFGSFATGKANEWSDIDFIVIAPEFDGTCKLSIMEKLWQATLLADIRIEPIACGEKEWETDQNRPILEIARREGIEISV